MHQWRKKLARGSPVRTASRRASKSGGKNGSNPPLREPNSWLGGERRRQSARAHFSPLLAGERRVWIYGSKVYHSFIPKEGKPCHTIPFFFTIPFHTDALPPWLLPPSPPPKQLPLGQRQGEFEWHLVPRQERVSWVISESKTHSLFSLPPIPVGEGGKKQPEAQVEWAWRRVTSNLDLWSDRPASMCVYWGEV